jgi:hypothetical protein
MDRGRRDSERRGLLERFQVNDYVPEMRALVVSDHFSMGRTINENTEIEASPRSAG